ncbi:MAG TPA: YhdP family protein [Steroidobacteraceae bacterium]|nr:YhdP family protein [Steroidobacteraceae bacterium]
MRKRSFRLWRIVAGTFAGLLVMAALLITALRIAIAYLPQHADTLRAWVEAQTEMRFQYSRLDARLRWFGPELVLRELRVMADDGSQTLFTAREGSVGLDLWNFFRTGQLIAGRVHIDRPRVTLVRLPDGRIRLLGLGERPADRPPFDLDRLPAGRLELEGATVVFRDLRHPEQPPLELKDLDGVLRRDRDQVLIEGDARLPEALGSRASFEVRLKGSLDEREHLDARFELRADSLRLAGLQDFLPPQTARPRSGRGPVHVIVALTQGQLSNARVEIDLRNVTLDLPARSVPPVEAVRVDNPRLERAAGNFIAHPTITKTMLMRPAAPLPQQVHYDTLAGDLRLRREGDKWTFRAEELRTQPRVARSGEPTRIAGSWWGRPVSRFGLTLEVDHAGVEQLWPLALAFAPRTFDRWAGLAPRGQVTALRLQAVRERAGLVPDFTVTADVKGLGLAPHDRLPGVTGITASLAGNQQGGKLELRARDGALDWPRMFAQPIRIVRTDADVTWRRDGEDWVIATRGARVEHPQGRGSANAELRLFRKPGVSPYLVVEAQVDSAEVASVPQFVPYGRLHERTIAWLDRAFIAGQVLDGKLSYRGPVRKFPFRDGEGDFRATARAHDATIDYYPGFAPLTHASGTVTFHNESIVADLEGGDVGGLKLGRTHFELSDYWAPLLTIDASAAGNLDKALAYVQASPLGPRIGSQFMALHGNGRAHYEVKLLLPAMSEQTLQGLETPAPKLDYFVRARLDGATVALPALRAPVQRLVGTFELHNEQVTVPALQGTLLDGPFELKASPGRLSREVSAAVDLTARGRLAGARLPAYIGLPSTIRMGGSAAWELRGRIEHRGEGEWPLVFDVTSNLVGLQIDAPAPFTKAPPEPRATHVRLEIPGALASDVTIGSGPARAKLRFDERDGRWQLERGTARFDGAPAELTAQPGLLVTGDWPQFDLAEWLALGDTSTDAPSAAGGQGPRLKDWLGPIDVHLARATVFGFEFTNIVAKLRGEADGWRVEVSGPGAAGRVTVPDDFSRGEPIVLDMQRLLLHTAAATPGAAPPESTPATDPRKLPALTVRAQEFAWEQRRLGRLEAVVVRDPLGLRFETLSAVAPAFEIHGSGSWLAEPAGTRTRLRAKLDSTDFAATTGALAYRAAVDAKKAHIEADVWWPGGPSGDAMKTLNGTMRLALEDGQMRDIEPGAGRMLGLLSVAQLPRRLALDFRDVTDEGLAFNTIQGDFEVRAGNAYTQNLLLEGPVVDVGIVGRTGLAAEDYDQTVVVSSNTSGPLAVAGALAAGPVVGAGVLVLSQLFKDQLQGLTRVYYHVAGPWSAPVVERISAPTSANTASAQADAGQTGSGQ